MTDTNQASEDELREKIDDVLSHFEVTVPNLDEVGLYDLVHPRIKDKYGNGVEWGIVINDEIMQLIRTEKLKLLDEVIHQSTVNLKSAKVVAGWAEIRKKQLEAEL